MDRKQFTFYSEYWDEIKRFRKKSDRLMLLEAICRYSLYQEEPCELPNALQTAFDGLRGMMDADFRSASEIRRSCEYKKWRKSVFERDDYTCQRCGAIGVHLNAHHVMPFAYYPDLRTDIDNGITLCVTCHKAVHHGS